MKIHEIITEERIDELNWRQAAARGLVGLASLGAASGVAASDEPLTRRVSPQADGTMSSSFAQQLSRQGIQPGAEEPGGTIDHSMVFKVDRDNGSIEHNNRVYKILRITKDGPQPRISRYDAKGKVNCSDMGFRCWGTFDAVLAGDNAFVYIR